MTRSSRLKPLSAISANCSEMGMEEAEWSIHQISNKAMPGNLSTVSRVTMYHPSSLLRPHKAIMLCSL